MVPSGPTTAHIAEVTTAEGWRMMAAVWTAVLVGVCALTLAGPVAGSDLELSLVAEAEGLFGYMQDIRR